MACGYRDSGARALREGLRELEGHRPDLAMRSLRASVDACPATRASELSRRLYWLAVALLRLDQPEIALKSLASAQKLRPRGLARSAYLARVNCYGMPKRKSPELDDFYAFYSIHACRFLSSREGRRFGSETEKDLVTRIITSAWLELKRSKRLVDLAPGARLELIKRWPVAFPSMIGASARANCGCEPVVVDFRRKRVPSADDRCPCGSGLPYRLCCGRTASSRELPR
jgi:hypothetical protein